MKDWLAFAINVGKLAMKLENAPAQETKINMGFHMGSS